MKNNVHNWTIVSCQSAATDEDLCSYLFFEQGALGLEVESQDEQNILIKASYPDATIAKNIEKLRQSFEKAKLTQAAKTLTVKTIANQDWLSNWKKHFKPFTVGESFLVCPPWRTDNITKEELGTRTRIVIDPGMAFGTGLHATTKYCLHAIERHSKGPRILDVGTGSGILAIACSILHPESAIVAIDNDINAINNAKQNIMLNQAVKQIKLKQASPEDLCQKTDSNNRFDTLLSNLTAEHIISLLAAYNHLLRAGGMLILAGIIEERLELLETALARYPLKVIEKSHNHGWVGLTLVKL